MSSFSVRSAIVAKALRLARFYKMERTILLPARLWLGSQRSQSDNRRQVLDWVCSAVQIPRMKPISNFVSLHPYFKVHSGKLDAFKNGFPAFVEKTAKEEKNLFYEFSVNGDEVFCREAYADADGLLAHLENVGALLAEALKIADLIRLEVHGPAADLEKLRRPMAHLNPSWFALLP